MGHSMYSGDSRFIAVGYRLFKLPHGVKREAAELTYKGGITGFEDELQVSVNMLYRFCM